MAALARESAEVADPAFDLDTKGSRTAKALKHEASDDGNLIPTVLVEGGVERGGNRYRGSSRPVAWQRVCLRGATHADTSTRARTRPGRGHPNTPNC
ncbi:hypothetical protein DPX16_20466 [Anabarilius grahami]|uniref:Uncharacterized protein n=1 Tax=Anabarilius grahami TaxID=495550 RepID=A0A3N0Z4E9_ANAGA|nr:hypothetical protein DPX16_20466 [Anabarilius grahami]